MVAIQILPLSSCCLSRVYVWNEWLSLARHLERNCKSSLHQDLQFQQHRRWICLLWSGRWYGSRARLQHVSVALPAKQCQIPLGSFRWPATRDPSRAPQQRNSRARTHPLALPSLLALRPLRHAPLGSRSSLQNPLVRPRLRTGHPRHLQHALSLHRRTVCYELLP